MNNRPLLQTIIFIAVGLITTGILLAAKIVFEQTDPGQRLEAYGYETLQSYLPYFTPRADMPVVVINIDKLEGGKEDHPTPRHDLEVILDALAKERPKAIALDMDFSPTEDHAWQAADDPDFFDFCLRLKNNGTPIFLGIDRTDESLPNAWLGREEYKPLAVGISFQPPVINRVILWYKPAGTSEKLPSLSLALAKSYRESLLKPPTLLAPLLVEVKSYEQEVEESDRSGYVYSEALVNYSMLEAIELETRSTISAASIAEDGERFRNRLVLIGRMSDARDKHVVPGRSTPIPSVLLQASATYTVVKSPLFEFTHKARILIDALLPLSVLTLIAILRHRNRQNADYDWHKKEWLTFIALVGLVFIGGIVLVRWVGVVWFDFLVVMIALSFHPALEKKVGAKLDQWLGVKAGAEQVREGAE